MSIKFICSCGKHLRARDEMAKRRSVCPRCGEPVGVPSLEPTQPGDSAGPMTPQERRRLASKRLQAPAKPHADDQAIRTTRPPASPPRLPPGAAAEGDPDTAAPKPLDPTAVRLLFPSKISRPPTPWQLETNWYHCLFYPFRAFPLILALGFALALMTGIAAFAVPQLLDVPMPPPGPLIIGLFLLMIPLSIASYTCGFLECVLASGAAGEFRQVRWPGGNMVFVMRSAVAWLVCLCAGPLELALGGFFYWLNCGEPGFLDWWILAEVGVGAVGYWLLAMLAVSRRDRLRDANPVSVLNLAHRLGHRALVAALVASGLAFLHGWLGIVALEKLHLEGLVGALLLLGCWISGLFWATFLMRMLGVWCYRSRVGLAG